MKKLITLLFIGMATLTYGQQATAIKFDIVDFNKKMAVAEWLYEYDMIAWRTSDSVMVQNKKDLARLGSDWFCFKKGDTWHAIYGKYENHQFDLVFHFTVDKGQVSKTTQPVDTTLLHRYSRALQTATGQIKLLKDTVNIRFNQYIKENDDKTLSVWILPAFQTNNVAVYGGEFIYTIDPTGTKVLKDESYFQGKFRGFNVGNPREIWLNYQETDKPTLGAVFFAWYYKSYFTKIGIDNSKSISTPFKSDGGWTWIHGEKQPEKK
ncbi:hypothetical protein [Nubsella zeaxanthinifaciens]|uniref:hypothetical protein n=1 Tax=Nubsella zeaxanthinifaciens TaxID=392412 RepID=UPI000DE229EF|nr:hypothetical protein [Nubsella zeaxanthinifaciens]